MSVDVSPFDVSAAAGVSALRTEGRAHLKVERLAGQTVAVDIEEEGPLRLRFPRTAADGVLEAIIVNTGGGIAGGDRLRFEVEAQPGTKVALTSQAAEKIYRSSGRDAEIAVYLSAEKGASLTWAPQESILFDRARVARTIEADVAADAALTICESIVFGRTAMGEAVVSGLLKDRWRVRRDGRLVFADAVTLDGTIQKILDRPAVSRGAIAAGTIVRLAPDAEAKIDAVRAALAIGGVEAGASAFDGMMVVRILAHDSIGLRAAVLATLSALGASPPRAFTL
jgi:urease accessory protein